MRPPALVVSLTVLVTTAALAQETATPSPLTAPPPGVSLTGRWILDPRLSDDPGDKVEEATKGLQSDRDDRGGRRAPSFPAYPGPGGITDQEGTRCRPGPAWTSRPRG